MAYQKIVDILKRDYECSDYLIRRYSSVINKGQVFSGGEVHHVLPRSLYPEFSNETGNLVRLSPKAHFISHLLLWKITNTKEMLFAFNCMRITKGVLKNSNTYQKSKEEFYSEIGKLASARMKTNNPMFREEIRNKLSERNKGKVVSQAQREKSSESLKKRWKERGHPRSGVVVTEETRAKISAANTGKNEGELNPFFGKVHTEESKKIMSEKKLGRMPWEMNRFNKKNTPFYLNADLVYSAWVSGIKAKELCQEIFGDDRYINCVQPITNRFKDGWVPSQCHKWLEWRNHHGV